MRAVTKLVSSVHASLHLSHPTPDCFIWNSLIHLHSRPPAHPLSAVSVYNRMRLHGVNPDFYTFPFLFLSFNSPSSFLCGQSIHAHILLCGFASERFVQTSLINMYLNCGCLKSAQEAFDEIPFPDLPSWNSIVSANLKMGLFVTAKQLFDKMPDRNVVSWSCMIDGCVKFGKYKEALEMFRNMLTAEVKPNAYTMSAVLSACGRLGALEHGKWAHAYIDRCGMGVDVILGTSLIDMYAKCGSIERAIQVFNGLRDHKDVLAWSVMISGLGMQGLGVECIDMFEEMQGRGLRPNSITFLGLLCGCVHSGLVMEGEYYFKRMSEEFGITPSIEHYGCLVDLYGRAGLIDVAWQVVKSMPMKPDVLIWGALLSGSRMHGDIETCEFSLKQLIALDPMNSGAYVLLSNVYAKLGLWEDVKYVRNVMETKGVKKEPGCSLVEVDGVLHEFFVGDKSHPQTVEIYLMLEEIMKRLKLAGYSGNTGEVLLDLDDEGKEITLSLHSEKLAIAFSFIKTRPGTPVRIIKNLRVCLDCHFAIKMISVVFHREIVVRDCNRFHHFKNGLCSCNDYW
ncbi:pentatricopeptide repeat-containing protein At3g62890 [Aristolochia californica]|uniref:pentatricopeptide repeat-containing protein At3g62890 n=1 Tax=Aristolochia californica TaxID=171875 RepID=UPI0035D77743